MRSSDLLVRCLEKEGVRRIFGIPGEENLDVMDSLIDSDIDFVLTKHECSAAFMAEIAARLSGEPGVCLSTLGPGATNLVTGVADAYLCYTPLIALTGQVRVERAYPPQKQYIDLVELFRPVTKASLSIRAPQRIPTIVRGAFDTAREERPGPVHLELPEDVMRCEAKGEPLPASLPERPEYGRGSLRHIREMIDSSTSPVILAGYGTLRAKAQEALRCFARSWNIPVLHTWMGSGILPFDDPLSLHTVGLRTHDFMRKAFEASDLVIAVGYDVMEFQPVFWNIGTRKNIVYLGAAPADAAPMFSPDLQAVGHLSSMLMQLTKTVVKKADWCADLRVQLHARMAELPGDTPPVKPQLAVKAVREALGRKDIAVSDVGAHLLWMEKLYPTYHENTLIASNGLISMGIGVPGAIAAKLTYPDRKVVAVCGDGGFMMTSSELETALRLNAPFVTVIFEDRGYGMIKVRQERNFGRSIGVDFSNPDFIKYAESFGAEGYKVESAAELKETLKRCLREDALAVIDVPIDYSENSRLAT